jgi:hypothetical protein
MVASAAEIPIFRLRSEIDMTGWVRLRAEMAQVVAGDGKPTLTALAVAACGRALREFPQVNASYREGRIERHGRVNVAVAVAAPEAVQELAFDDLDAPIERVGAPFQPVPLASSLEDTYLPGAAEVRAAVLRTLERR